MKFKKSISLVLVMCMVLSLFASFVVSAEEAAEVTNIAAGKAYTTSLLFKQGGKEVGWGWDENASVTYPDEDGKSLTDGAVGAADAAYSDAVWAGFNHNSPDYKETGYSWITVDLGAVETINKAVIYVGTSALGSGIGAKNMTVEFFVSDDNQNWTSIGSAAPEDIESSSVEAVAVTADASGRYVQARMVRGGWMFVSEVEVYGISSTEEEPEEVTVLGVDRVNNYDWTEKDFASDVYTPAAASAGEIIMAVSAEGKTVADLVGGNWFTWWYKVLAKWDAEKELYVITAINAPSQTDLAYEAWTLGEGDIVIMCNTGYAATEPAGNAADAEVIKALAVGDTLALNKTTWETLSVSSGALDGVYLTVNAPALEPVVPEEPVEDGYNLGLNFDVSADVTNNATVEGLTDGNWAENASAWEDGQTAGVQLVCNTACKDATKHPDMALVWKYEKAVAIEAINLGLYSSVTSMVGYPELAAVLVSVDGSEWTTVTTTDNIPVAKALVDDATAPGTIKATITLDEVATAKYVKVVLLFPDSPFTVESGKYTEETAKPVWEFFALTEAEVDLVVPSAEAVLPEGSGVTFPDGYGAIGVLGDGYTGVGEIDNYDPYQKYLFAFRNGTVDVESTYSIKVDLDAVVAFNTVTAYALSFTNGNVGLPKAVSVTIGDNTYDAVIGSEDNAINAIVAELGETVEASEFTINVTMNSGAVKYNMYSEIEVALVEAEEPEGPEEVEGGDLPAHNPRVNGALSVPANTAISYTVAFENGANFSLYDETISVLVNGEALEFGMLGYATTLAKGDVVTIVNEGAEAVELYPSISEVIFGTMGNPIVLEELGDIVANVTEAIISDSGAVHYVYTATVNGTLTITMPEGNWTYTVNNLTAGIYGDTQSSDSDPVLSTYTIEVAEGDEIQIIVGTYDPENPWAAPAGELAFNVVEEATPVAPEDPKEIVDAAFALESGAELPYVATLTGKIVKINTPYSEQYGNITVTIEVEGTDGVKELLCYRIKGEGADTLAVGDTITVTGTIINYNGTIEYAAGSTIDAIEKGEGEVPVAPEDPKEIVDAAFGLEEGASLPYNATLTGVIVSVDTAYDAGYKNVTVSIEVEGTDGLHVIQCFRLKGEGADVIGVGDTITVTGVIKNYYGKIEFDAGCTLDSYVEYVPEYNEVEIDVNENSILTDGKTGFTGNWGEVGTGDVLLISNGECKNMAMQVVLNYALGETKTINGLVLDFYHCAAVMIGYPEGQILVEVSVDGENWTKVGLFDLAAAELANGKYGTVSSALEFDAVEAAYVKATFVVGTSTGVLGDSPADGKVFWEFASLAEVAVTEVKTTVTGNFAEEGLNGVNQFAANAHNIWTGSVASIEWWTKALLQWNDEAQGWEVLKVQGNGKVDWVTEGNQIVLAAHADNGAAVAAIAALQVGDIVYIWDIGVATSDKLSADVDCNGGFYTTDADKVGTTAFTYKEKVALAGDVNMDGVITDADYMIIRKLVVGTANAADYTAEQLKLADVNGNGVIDANDYLVVKRHALGTYVIPAWK